MRIYITGRWFNSDRIREIVTIVREKTEDNEIYCFLEQEKAYSDEDISNERDARAFYENIRAIRECDVLVLVGPAGRGSYIEAGYAAGLDKLVVYYKPFSDSQPELMYGLFNVCDGTDSLLERLREYKSGLVYGTR